MTADLFWDGLWASGATASWVSRSTAQRQASLGVVPAWMLADPAAALARCRRQESWPRMLRILGFLEQWRTATTEQIARATADPKVANPKAAVWRDLFCAGLVDLGKPVAGVLGARAGLWDSHGVVLVRQSDTRVFDTKVRPLMTGPEIVAVTGDGQYRARRQYDRHNLLSVELGLRAAHLPGVRCTLGEKWANAAAVAVGVDGADLDPTVWGQRDGDLVIVRADGARIVVEVSASMSNTVKKARYWADLFLQASSQWSGVSVLFVDVTPMDRREWRREWADLAVRGAVLRTVRETPGPAHDPTWRRFACAQWADWFPASGQTSHRFARLRAQRIRPSDAPDLDAGLSLGDKADRMRRAWSDVDLLDTDAFCPVDPDRRPALLAVADNARLLAGGVLADASGGGHALWRDAQARAGLLADGLAPAAWAGVHALDGADRAPARLRDPLGRD